MARPKRQTATRKAQLTTSAASASSSSAWKAPSILVASTLIINACEGCQAAPRPVQTDDVYQRRTQQQHRARGFHDVDDSAPSWAGEEKRAHDAMIERQYTSGSTALMKRNATSPTTPTRHTYAVSTGTGRSIVVPSAFASSIASSWDPRKRSVWFQRKAVIITSVFLAILIVLIIGAAAFMRDKRELDAEGEVDVSDEAALKRMKEERDMRNGGGKRDKRRKKELKGDEASIKTVEKGTATGIALRWAKVPVVRRLRKSKKRTASSRSSPSEESVVHHEDLPAPHHVDSANDAALSPVVEQTDSSAQAMQPADAAAVSDSMQSTTDSSSAQPSASSRDPLSVADLSAAEAELERQLNGSLHDEEVDAFPPAYISRGRDELHPSANRQLAAGSSRIADGTSSSEEKRAVSSHQPATTDEGHEVSELPSIAEGTSSRGAQDHYSGHVATDDKTLLRQLHHAASAPSAPPGQGQESDTGASHDSSLTTSLQPSSHASAPVLEVPHAPNDDLTEEELNIIQGSDKGKAASTLLPAPPRPLSSSAFSRFDMPYVIESAVLPSPTSPNASNRTVSKASSEKEQEAAEERRRTVALVESRPEDLVHLPKYETAPSNVSAPSAPPSQDLNELDQHHTPAVSPAPSAPSAPSAPPADE